jgi:hypothetical protein
MCEDSLTSEIDWHEQKIFFSFESFFLSEFSFREV